MDKARARVSDHGMHRNNRVIRCRVNRGWTTVLTPYAKDQTVGPQNAAFFCWPGFTHPNVLLCTRTATSQPATTGHQPVIACAVAIGARQPSARGLQKGIVQQPGEQFSRAQNNCDAAEPPNAAQAAVRASLEAMGVHLDAQVPVLVC